VPERHLLADHTTLRLGGPAGTWVRATSTEELVSAVSAADRAGEPVLLVSGGSNLVIADEGFSGTVIEIATTGVRVSDDGCGGVSVTVAAGEPWDPLVARAVDEGWIGTEALSGIPGSVGATPIQNVGAYGQDVADTVASVRCWDRREDRSATLAAADCGFGYRTSRFKREPQRYVVLDVTFQLRPGTHGTPIGYAQLADALGVAVGERVETAAVRDAVLSLRRSKGMVLDSDDHDTWSAGSFFTNPVLDAGTKLPDGAPQWQQPDGSVKTSAAWLIEHAGFGRGYGNDRVSLSTKHTLALTNRGHARTTDLLELAREIRDGVREKFGITLANEPVLVGCAL
jgi:UDP-N-acetylmuramate dehydrogenase